MSPSGSVDAEKGIIQGVVIARTGPVRGHNGLIDQVFLAQLCSLAQLRPQGIKARFGHPNMCATALGSYLGRFHNFTLLENKVIADLHLDPTSRNTPQGNLFDYVISMASGNPDMLGASIVFEAAEFEYTETVVEGKTERSRLFRLKELRAADIVDDPAAADGMFSAHSLPALATQWLDENPEITRLIFSKPDSLIEFLNNYLNTTNMNFSDSIREAFRKAFGLVPAPDPQPEPQPLPEPDPIALALENLINTRFSLMKPLMNLPEISQDENGLFFFENEGVKLQMSPLMKLEALLVMMDASLSELQDARSSIQLLNDKLAARPSVPSQVTDPQVSVELNTPARDEAGKGLIQSLPPDLRMKLFSRLKARNQ